MPPGVHQATVRGGAETVRDPAAAVVAGASTTSGKWEALATLAAFCLCRVRMCLRAPMSPQVPPAMLRREECCFCCQTQSLLPSSVALSLPWFPCSHFRLGASWCTALWLHPSHGISMLLPFREEQPLSCCIILKAVCSTLESGQAATGLHLVSPPCHVGFRVPSEGFCFPFLAGMLYAPSCAVCILDIVFLFNLVLSYLFNAGSCYCIVF